MEHARHPQVDAWLMAALGGALALTIGCRPAPEAPADFGTLAVRVGHESIWLVRGRDKPRLLTQGARPQLAPDGCHLIFRRPGDDDSCNQNGYGCSDLDVWFINVAGTEIKRLFSPYDEWEESTAGLEWAPNAKGLAATTMGTAKALPRGDLYWVSVPRGAITQLAVADFQGGNNAGGTPHFSPDSKWVATTQAWTGYTQAAVGLVGLDTHTARQVFYPLWAQGLVWADDSGGFVVALLVRRGVEKEDVTLRGELWWVPVVGEPKQLGELGDGNTVRSLRWQPGGQRLAYLYAQPGKESGSVHLVARDGSQNVEVPGSTGMEIWGAWQASEDHSAWSPDGTWLLLQDGPSASRPGSTPRVYLVNTQRLASPQLLDVGSVQGWLDATHYLVSNFKGDTLEFSVCDTDRACQLWAQVPMANPDQDMSLSYVNKICTK